MISNEYLVKRHRCAVIFYALLALTLCAVIFSSPANGTAAKIFTPLVYISGTGALVTAGVYKSKYSKKSAGTHSAQGDKIVIAEFEREIAEREPVSSGEYERPVEGEQEKN